MIEKPKMYACSLCGALFLGVDFPSHVCIRGWVGWGSSRSARYFDVKQVARRKALE
jgi:hypothetical protein